MGKLDIIKELINPEATVQLTVDYQKCKCVLDEPDSDYYVEVLNVPDDAIVIKADVFDSPINFFNGSKMECKRADYIMIVEQPEPQILFIELKRSKASSTNKEIYAQLKGSYCLMQYCENIIEQFWEQKEIFDEFETRYYVFYSLSVNKKMSYKRNRGKDNLKPEDARKLSQKTIQYRHLIS